MASEIKPDDLDTLPIIEKIIYFKPVAPLAKKVLEDRKLGPAAKKFLSREVVTYLFFGVVTTILNFIAYSFLLYINISVFWTNIISSVIAILFAFVVNKHFVFLSKDWSPRKTGMELWQFAGGRVIIMLGESWLLKLLVDVWGFNGIICKIFTVTLVMIANYFISKFIF